MTRILESGESEKLRQLFKRMETLDPATLATIGPAFLQMAAKLTDPALRKAAEEAVRGVFSAVPGLQPAYPKAKVDEIHKLAELQATSVTTATPDGNGVLRVKVALGGNGSSFVVISPLPPPPRSD